MRRPAWLPTDHDHGPVCLCKRQAWLVDQSSRFPPFTVYTFRCECGIEGPQAADWEAAGDMFAAMIAAIPAAYERETRRREQIAARQTPAARAA